MAKKLKSMPCSFTEFTERLSIHGYTEVADQTVDKKPYQLYAVYVRTVGGARVKLEIKPNKYTLGYGLNPDNLEKLRVSLLESGMDVVDGSKCINIKYTGTPTVDTIFTKFFSLIDAVVEIDDIVAQQRGQATKVFTREETDEAIFEKIAKRYRFAIDNKDQDLLDLGRDLLSGDSIDHIIVRGHSVNRTPDNSYREHIVPCIMIHNHAIEMTLSGASIAEVAQMIAENLAIVLITPEEANRIDVDLKLRTTMPVGWTWGDSVFARLDAGDIRLA